MSRLFRFLMKLAAEHYYGVVTIRFQDGKIHGQVEAHQAYLESTLPEPDVSDPAYQKVLAEATKGVSLVA